MFRRRTLTNLVLLALPLSALANQPPELDAAALAERLLRLEQRLGIDSGQTNDDREDSLASLSHRLAELESRLDEQEASVAKAASNAIVTVDHRGFAARSPEGGFEIRVRGGIHLDNRRFIDDDPVVDNGGFLFRRIRPTLEGSLGPLAAFRITPELAGDTVTLQDAWVDLRFSPAATLRVGKMKSPIGLERLQSLTAIPLIERGFPTELAPNRDVGAQLQGALYGGRVSYQLGLFNGTVDGRSSAARDADNEREVSARIFFEPWKGAAHPLAGLGFGVAASHGDKEGAGNAFLPRYRTPGQATVFNYRPTVFADGEHTRISPQAYYYAGAFGIQAEYIRSEQTLGLTSAPEGGQKLDNSAWQVTAGWVLTGETAAYSGTINPNQPFEPGKGGWGAFELVGRYGELSIDDDAFPLFANPDAAAEKAEAWGIGLNWHLNRNVKLVFNHTQSRFDGGAANGADRDTEKTFFSRLQLAF
ncbi:MAG: porin [Xanthomonadaceae bacterium]|nr:porin [Xanthomonadaceae bacterium]